MTAATIPTHKLAPRRADGTLHLPKLLRRFDRRQRYCVRVRRMAHWLAEGRHGWTQDPKTHVYWADNSETIEEFSQLTGQRRTVTITGPGGDVCF